MKFLRVAFRCFGPFDEQSLDLSGKDGLRIIFGENEAGKSSALRGLLAFLFGFDIRSEDDFRFKHNQFRVHAVLESASAKTLECIRRKGNKDTLRKSCDKEVVPDGHLNDFVGGLDKGQFEQLFGLDAERLREGGDAIAEGKGQLGKALFAAGAGMKELRVLSQRLSDRMGELYLPGGKKQRITEAVREYRDQMEEARKLELAPEDFAEKEKIARESAARVEELARERIEARAQQTRLGRYKAALPTIDLLRTTRDRLAAVKDAPILSADFDKKFGDVRDRLVTTRAESASLESERRRLTDLLEKETPSATLLNEEGEIGEIAKQVGADVKARREEVKEETFARDERGKARDIYRELTGSTDWENMGGLKLRLEEQNQIHALANERSAIVEDLDRQTEAVRENQQALAQVRNKQNETSIPVDPSLWQDAVEEIAASGPLERQLSQLANTIQAEERKLADEWARFNPAPPGDWRQASGQPMPLAETVEWFRQELENARARVEKAAQEKSDNEKELASARRLLIDKVGSEAVPTADELMEARRDRDAGLHSIRVRLGGNLDETGEARFIQRHAPGRPMIDAVESSVRQCDTLADRLRHEADRVAVYQTLQQQIKTLEGRIQTLESEERQAKDAQRAIEMRWQAAWESSGVSASSPKVMQAWLAKWNKFVESAVIFRSNCQIFEESKQRIDELRARLGEACPAARTAKTLVDGLAAANRAIADAATARTEAGRLDEEAKRLEIALQKAELDQAKARHRHEEWGQKWSAAVAVLRLKDASPSIETARDYLNRIDQMQHHLKDMRIKESTMKLIRDERECLLERINALRRRLNSACRPTTLESLDTDFRAIESALRDACDCRTRNEDYTKQLAEVEKKRARIEKNVTDAEAALSALAAEAGVEPEVIPAAMQRARERSQVAAQVRQYEEALAQIALGEPMEVFVESALAEREDLNQRLEALANKVEGHDRDVSNAEVEANGAKRVLAGYLQASNEAAVARQEAALLAAHIKDLVVEFATIHVARMALDKAKESYRARHQGTLLDRAGAYFKRLTDGAFADIEIDNENGEDVLKAVRAAANRPDGRVAVSGLSDGTRDQLFLALRLAGIEQHLREREPMPLIVDDVLVNFDDARSKATLECLAELAKLTQVIIFTHHGHLVDLAREVDKGAVVCKLAPFR